MVPAGRLNTLVEFQAKTQEHDRLLAKREKWGEGPERFAQAWCSFEAGDGTESQPYKQTIATNVWTLKTTWTTRLAAVTKAMRVKLPDGRLLGIKSIVNFEMRNRELWFVCEGLG